MLIVDNGINIFVSHQSIAYDDGDKSITLFSGSRDRSPPLELMNSKEENSPPHSNDRNVSAL